jgi:hypothetical protein
MEGSVRGVIFVSRLLSGRTEENSENPQASTRSCGQDCYLWPCEHEVEVL